MMYNLPENFIKMIREALEEGDYQKARQLAFQAVEKYPEEEQVLKYAYLLAPPMVILGNPPPEDRHLYREWLKTNHFKYRKRWVALWKGQFLAEAEGSDDLKEQVGKSENIVMVSIG